MFTVNPWLREDGGNVETVEETLSKPILIEKTTYANYTFPPRIFHSILNAGVSVYVIVTI